MMDSQKYQFWFCEKVEDEVTSIVSYQLVIDPSLGYYLYASGGYRKPTVRGRGTNGLAYSVINVVDLLKA